MLFIDKANNVWAGLTQKGLIRLNKTNKTFSQYDIVSQDNNFYSRELRNAYNNVYDMYEQGNDIYWLATHDGLYKFNSGTGQMEAVRSNPVNMQLMRDDLFSSIANDANGLWL